MIARFHSAPSPMMRLRPALGLALAMVAGLGWPAAADAADFVGHRALYHVSLKSAETRSGVASVRGAVLYRFADACDGWTAENRTLLRIDYGEGAESESEWSHLSWESKDGLRFRFHVRDIREGELAEELQGQASLTAPRGPGLAHFALPEERDLKLPTGTQFPTRHLMALLDAARSGRRHESGIVFDGSSLDNPYSVGAVVRQASESARRSLGKRAKLTELPVWSLRLAFFPMAASEATPKFEIGITLREDGIADSIVQDFGDFVLLLTLQNVELLPKPDC
ncbi:MAG: DUF1849 family protein [Rhodospirillales bacterium]|nr:DUF1849 family protein [Rhodospirillales bacterium]